MQKVAAFHSDAILGLQRVQFLFHLANCMVKILFVHAAPVDTQVREPVFAAIVEMDFPVNIMAVSERIININSVNQVSDRMKNMGLANWD